MLKCRDCGEYKPESCFYKSHTTTRSYTYYCKQCSNIRTANYKQKHPNRVKENHRTSLFRQYGITESVYNALLEAQGGKCAICPSTEPGGTGAWHIDHDHTCCPTKKRSCGNCIRGLLCSRCNILLGLALDMHETLDAASAYLKKAKKKKRR